MTTCANCQEEIVGEDWLKKEYYQEEFPEIIFGPYCQKCFSNVRVCDCCQHPFQKEVGTHEGKGIWKCANCKPKETEQRDTLDEIVATYDCISGKTALQSVCNGDVALQPFSSGIVIHSASLIPWYQVRELVEALQDIYKEYVQ